MIMIHYDHLGVPLETVLAGRVVAGAGDLRVPQLVG